MSNNKPILEKSIQRAINSLEETNPASNQMFPVSIMIQTSEDEAVLVGTIDSYINLIIKLLQTISKVHNVETGKVTINKIETQFVPIDSAFSSLGHIVPRSLCLAESDETCRKIVDFFQNL
jgi:hypothetical protein